MSEYKKKIVKLSKGQLSPYLIERTDIGLLDDSGQTVNNFINSKYGLFGTQKGTAFVRNLGKFADFENNGARDRVKLFKLNLPSGDECLLVVKTEYNSLTKSEANTFYVFSHTGALLSQYTPTEHIFSVENLNQSKIVQNNDSIIVVSKGNPLYTFSLTTTGEVSNFGVFNIDLENVIKVSTLDSPAINPVLFRLSDDTLPESPLSLGIGDGDFVELSATGAPSIATETALKQMRVDKEDGHTYWTDAVYTPKRGDYCLNFDNKYYVYTTVWGELLSYSDTHYGNVWSISGVSGYVQATINGGIVITKPTAYVGTPEQFARRLLIGCDFDGEENIGFFRIDSVIGTTSGNNFTVTSLKGTAYLGFWKASTNFTGFSLKLGMKPAFDTDRVGTVNNIFGTTNYPLNAFFFQQRLFLAGTEQDTTQIVASQLGTYNNFSNDYSGASTNAFQLEIAGTEKETIQNVMINQGLQIFTDKGEWLVQDNAITTTSGFLRNSTIGSSYVEPIISANGVTLFTPKQGNGLVGFVYNYETASFQTPTISLLTDVFATETHSMTLRKAFDTQDDTLIYITLNDGTMIVGNYLRDQDIQSFVTRKNETTKYLQVIQIENTVFYVQSLSNGNVVLVKEDDSVFTECATKANYNANKAVYGLLQTFSVGDKVNLYDGDNRFVASFSVPDGGVVSLPDILPDGVEPPAKVSTVGYNIESTFKSNPINQGAETFGAYKTLRSASFVLTPESDSSFMTVNGKKGVVKNVNGNKYVTFSHLTRPTRECTFEIKNSVYPLKIMSITLDYEV